VIPTTPNGAIRINNFVSILLTPADFTGQVTQESSPFCVFDISGRMFYLCYSCR
jgi:hypothetical protein